MKHHFDPIRNALFQVDDRRRDVMVKRSKPVVVWTVPEINDRRYYMHGTYVHIWEERNATEIDIKQIREQRWVVWS